MPLRATPFSLSLTGPKEHSLVTCLHLVTTSEERIKQVSGGLSPDMLHRLNGGWKAALELIWPLLPSPYHAHSTPTTAPW